jgi:hypothetical protein
MFERYGVPLKKVEASRLPTDNERPPPGDVNLERLLLKDICSVLATGSMTGIV